MDFKNTSLQKRKKKDGKSAGKKCLPKKIIAQKLKQPKFQKFDKHKSNHHF